MLKHHGILFSPALYPKVQGGTKDVTRRTSGLDKVNENPDDWTVSYSGYGCWTFTNKHDGKTLRIKSRYGVVGDLLYLKETHYQYGHWERDYKHDTATRTAWKFVPDDDEVLYENNPPAHFKSSVPNAVELKYVPCWYKRNGMFMPKAAARLWREVVSVRPERLQDITEEDAIREGIQFNPAAPASTSNVGAFSKLWNSIYGAGAFARNGWVWRVEFGGTDMPGV